MTLRSFEEEAIKIDALVGARVVRVRIGHAGVLLVDFDKLHPPDGRGLQRADKELLVGCPWRIESLNQVLAGYLDTDDAALEQAVQVLIGVTVVECQTSQPSYSFLLRFDSSVSLLGFPCDTVYYSEDEQFSSPWFVTGTSIP